MTSSCVTVVFCTASSQMEKVRCRWLHWHTSPSICLSANAPRGCSSDTVLREIGLREDRKICAYTKLLGNGCLSTHHSLSESTPNHSVPVGLNSSLKNILVDLENLFPPSQFPVLSAHLSTPGFRLDHIGLTGANFQEFYCVSFFQLVRILKIDY